MSNVFFPQLSIGATAQYPVLKQRTVRTVRNVMRDGSLLSYPDSGAGTLKWNLEYVGLSQNDASELKALFDACSGPLQPFTFLDPTGNGLAWSSDLTNSVWQRLSLISIASSCSDPRGGTAACTLINNGQAYEEFTQSISLPSNYQYCFSVAAASSAPSSLILIRRGSNTEDQTTVELSSAWKKVQTSGRLNDGGTSFTVGVRLAPGQAISLYGPQLESQLTSSPYRSTAGVSGLFPNCFWASEEIAIRADGPNSFSTEISLETTI